MPGKRNYKNKNQSRGNLFPSEIEAWMELHLPCLVKVGKGNNGSKTIEEFLPEAVE
jgi:hypothetical protein